MMMIMMTKKETKIRLGSRINNNTVLEIIVRGYIDINACNSV